MGAVKRRLGRVYRTMGEKGETREPATTAPSPKKFISYLRVSTARQGRSGLGLEAQREAVRAFIAGENGGAALMAEYVEFESGKRTDRPELDKALEHCNLIGAVLIIAKLDRLSRDAHFLLGLEKAGVEFRACDMPQADRTMVGVMAMIAEHEGKAISRRTKEALSAAKARGKKLGNPMGGRLFTPEARARGNAASLAVIKEKVDEEVERLRKPIAQLQAEGITSASALARALDERGILAPSDARRKRRGKEPVGVQWHPQMVLRILSKLGSGGSGRVG